jgi:hypothetical protein
VGEFGWEGEGVCGFGVGFGVGRSAVAGLRERGEEVECCVGYDIWDFGGVDYVGDV